MISSNENFFIVIALTLTLNKNCKIIKNVKIIKKITFLFFKYFFRIFGDIFMFSILIFLNNFNFLFPNFFLFQIFILKIFF